MHMQPPLTPPLSGRTAKPRRTGLTMVIDKGLGMNATEDMLRLAADYVDFVKLGFGTALLYDPDMLLHKVTAVKAAGVHVYPGGTLLEVAVQQGKVAAFLEWCRTVEFTHVEVSDGTIDLSPSTRRELIRRARDMGFGVLSEVGKKDPHKQPDAASLVSQMEDDLTAGVDKVIIEARDGGRSIGIFDDNGKLRDTFFEELLRHIPTLNDVIWEAPLSSQQQALLVRLGPNVSFGNVQPPDVVSLEAMRVGLRGDTFRLVWQESVSGGGGIRQTI